MFLYNLTLQKPGAITVRFFFDLIKSCEDSWVRRIVARMVEHDLALF
jgi:hypothetical protein